jgi:hypothetical protein
MPFLAGSLALSTLVGDTHAEMERRRADAWRELHRRPDAEPDAPDPVPVYRRFRVASIAIGRRHAADGAR